MSHCIERSPVVLFTLLAVGLSAPSVSAQEIVAEPSQPSSLYPEPDDRFCRTHWLAVGRCRDRHRARPVIMFGLDLGVSVMNETGPFGFNKGVGAVMDPGPAWGARLGVELFRWLALEARYVGMSNSAQASVSPAGGVGFVTTGAEAVVRFTAPLPFVHPYVFGGVGYYDVSLVGSSTAKAGSVLFSSAQPGVPVGFGLDVPLTWRLSVGVEAAYHWQLAEKYSLITKNGIDGGDLSTCNGVLRFRL